MTKKNLLLLIFFSIIFLNLSLLLFLQVSPLQSHCDIDSKAYLEKSDLLYKTGSFAPTPVYKNFPYYTLGYPIFMASIYKIFGQSINWIILIQVLLTLLSAFLIFITTKRIFHERVGIIAFALTCINIGFLTFSQFILTESFLTLFLILFFERFTGYIHSKKTNLLMQAALALGVSVIIKPAALYFPILLLPLIYYTNKSLRAAYLFLILYFAPILIYMAHNKVVYNEFKIANLASINTYFWFYPNILAQKHNTNSDFERIKLQILSGPNNTNIQAVKDMFLRDLIQNPILFTYVWLKNVIKTFLGLFTTNLKVLVEPTIHGGDISFFKIKGSMLQKVWTYIESGATSNCLKVVGFYEAVWSILRYILCFIAIFTLFKYRKYTLVYFITSYIFYFSMITGHDGCARFRMMFEFVLIILASFGIWIIFTKKERTLHESGTLCNSCRR